MIKFLYPQYLFFIFLSIIASFFYLKRVKRLKAIIGSEEIAQIYFNRIKCRTFLFSLSFCFLCVALASPMYGTQLISIKEKGASLIFVIDISNSMTIKERDVSRLSRAKYIADYTIEKYPNIAFGLVLAKGDGVLSIPLTFEHDVLREQISLLSPLMMSEAGTNLEKGILKAISHFCKDRSDFRIVLVLTDGEETKGEMMKTVKEIAKNNVFLVLVGLGTKEGGRIDILNEAGEKTSRLSVLEEENLKEVARLCEGLYVNGEDTTTLKALFGILDEHTIQKEKISFKKEERSRRSEAAFFALLLFCSGVIVGMNKFSFRFF